MTFFFFTEEEKRCLCQIVSGLGFVYLLAARNQLFSVAKAQSFQAGASISTWNQKMPAREREKSLLTKKKKESFSSFCNFSLLLLSSLMLLK